MKQAEKTLRKRGEKLFLLTTNNERLPFIASLQEMTSAGNSVNNRAHGFKGLSLKHTLDASDTLILPGMYCQRNVDSENTYLIDNYWPEPNYDNLVYMFLMRCNCVVDLLREVIEINPEDETQIKIKWKLYASNILVNKGTTKRSFRENDNKLTDASFSYVHIPRSYGVQLFDRMKICDKLYRIESIDDSLVDDNGKTGVDIVQIQFMDEEAE